MLAPADAALAARDPVVPGIATVLDPRRLEGALAGALGRSGLSLRSAQLEYLRYRPGRALLGSVRVLTDQGEALAYVEARDAARPPARLEPVEPRRRRPVSPLLTWAPWADPATGVALGPDVVDPVLPGARELTVHERRFLRRVEPADGAHGTAHRVRAVRHKPGRRWVARVDRDGVPWALAKAVPVRRVRRLTEPLAGLGRTAPVAPLLHLDARRGVYLVRWVDGDPLPARPDPALLREVGAVLAVLHAHPAPARCTAPDLATGLEVAVRAVDEVLPAAARDARRVAARVRNALDAPLPRSLVHGDLSADQVVLTAAGPVLVDLDRCRVDHPLGDVAGWLAADVAAGRAPVAAWEDAQSLLDGYREAGEVAGDTRALGALAALALLRRATEPFRHRPCPAGRQVDTAPADWEAEVAALLRHALDLASWSRACV